MELHSIITCPDCGAAIETMPSDASFSRLAP